MKQKQKLWDITRLWTRWRHFRTKHRPLESRKKDELYNCFFKQQIYRYIVLNYNEASYGLHQVNTISYLAPSFGYFFGLISGFLRLTSSVLYTRLSGFPGHVSWGGSVWDAWVREHASHAWCLRLPFVAGLGGCCVLDWGCLLFGGACSSTVFV